MLGRAYHIDNKSCTYRKFLSILPLPGRRWIVRFDCFAAWDLPSPSHFSLFFFLFAFPLPFREIWTRSMEFLNRAILNFNLSTADFYANFREKRWKDQGSGIRFISLEYHIMR